MIVKKKGPKDKFKLRVRLYLMRDPTHEPEQYETDEWAELVELVRKNENRDMAIICHEDIKNDR